MSLAVVLFPSQRISHVIQQLERLHLFFASRIDFGSTRLDCLASWSNWKQKTQLFRTSSPRRSRTNLTVSMTETFFVQQIVGIHNESDFHQMIGLRVFRCKLPCRKSPLSRVIPRKLPVLSPSQAIVFRWK